MRLKNPLPLAIVTLFVCVASSTFAQAPPAAKGPKAFSPLAIGGGVSAFNPEPSLSGHLLGGTLWVDYFPDRTPSLLHGIGIEVEARDLNYARSNSKYPDLRLDEAEGGVIYSYPGFSRIRPYGKFLLGFGNLDQNLLTISKGELTVVRHHDTRNMYIPGAGVDYRVFHQLWLRGDYEYQWWPDMKFGTVNNVYTHTGSTHPQGFTVGAMYHF